MAARCASTMAAFAGGGVTSPPSAYPRGGGAIKLVYIDAVLYGCGMGFCVPIVPGGGMYKEPIPPTVLGRLKLLFGVVDAAAVGQGLFCP